MDLRLQFVTEYRSGLYTMAELCEQYRVSRKTGHKFVARYAADGPCGLVDRSRRPHESPRATPPEVVAALVAARHRHPLWGARKLIAWLRRAHPQQPWPHRTTACGLLKRQGLIRARRRRARASHVTGRRLVAITAPNQVWTVDFKGQFRTGDGLVCYPLTLRDGYSRYVLRCDALAGPTYEGTRRGLERAFGEYGLPACIRSDNGSPFAGPGLARLSRLAVWWMRLGIVPDRIAVGHPEQNGAHEQFHAVLKAGTARPPAATLRAQHRRFQIFCREYNQERPHESLGDEPPATRYVPSPRPLPSRLPAIEYPGHLEVRRVNKLGCVSWRSQKVFLTEALIGESIAFEEVDDGLWTVWLGSIALARFNERTGHLTELTRWS